MSPNHKGSISELIVAAELAKHGCEVFGSLMNCSQIDLIAINQHGKRFCIQVKTGESAGKANGKRRIHTKRENKNGGAMKPYSHIDFFIGCHEADCWIFPLSSCNGTEKYLAPDSEYKNAWHLIED